MWMLEKLALCHHYRPAIQDIVALDPRGYSIKSRGIKAYYFAKLAEKLGFDIRPNAEKLKASETGMQGLIDRIFKRYPVEVAVDKLPFRAKSCALYIAPLH
jgi:hypothetical protein